MKTESAMILVRTLAMVSVATILCSAASPSFARPWRMGQMDDTGITQLGVDIQGAGSTPENIREFLAGLPTGQAPTVRTACEYTVAHQVYQDQNVLSFCMAVARAR
jgi:hypothetical protein